MLTFNPAEPAQYPNGRVFTDDVINYRLAFLSKGEIPPTGLSPHTDTLGRVSVPGDAAPGEGLKGAFGRASVLSGAPSVNLTTPTRRVA